MTRDGFTDAERRAIREMLAARNAPRPFPMVLVKGTADIAKGASGTVTVYSGTTKGSEATATQTLSVFSRIGDYTANNWAYALPVDTGWEIVNAECA